MDLLPVFLLAAKAGALEGYLFDRKEVASIANWIDNIRQGRHDLSPEVRKKLAPVLTPVLERALEHGKETLSPALKEKLAQIFQESTNDLLAGKASGGD